MKDSASSGSLQRLRRRLVLLLAIYFIAGVASQKLIPGVDEIFPFFGWSLFSKVPNVDSRYTLLIHRHQGNRLDPAVPFLRAPRSIVTGNRYIGRKVIQRLGRALDRNNQTASDELRSLLAQHYFRGRVRYEIVFEQYQPLQKWRTGLNLTRRSLGSFATTRDRRDVESP